MLRKMAKNHALAAALGEKHSRRTRGDNALSSSAALIFFKLVANSADDFAMKRRSGGRQFKSTLLHTSVSRYSDDRRIDRNARVCARFAIALGPGERLGRRKSPESGKTYPGAILLGPRIIAIHSPAIS